jgi:hypothetical protein
VKNPYNLPIDDTLGRPPANILRALEDHLIYDPDTGDMIWSYDNTIATRTPTYSEIKANKVAARSPSPLVIDTATPKLLLAHHVAWFMYTGEWPQRIVHLDKNPKNNAIANLRRSRTGKPAQPK